MKHEQRHGIPVLTFRGHAGAPQDAENEWLFDVACIVALLAIAVIAAIWISLWAINKPVHPSACDQHRSECAAAVEAR